MSEYQISVDEIERRLGRLADKSGRVVANAANRALLTTGAHEIRKKVVMEYNVREKDVTATLRKIKATWSNPTAVLDYKGTHENLYHFGLKKVLSPRNIVRSPGGENPDPKFVEAQIMRRGGKVALDQNPKPFVQASNGGIALFQRMTPDSRAEIRGVPAPAIPQIVKNEDILEKARIRMREVFYDRVDHEIERVLGGH